MVGYTGLLHLGIAAFFGIGAYITGILTVPAYPFQVGFRGGAGAVDGRRGAGWACCSARRRCGCAATTWRSSRSGFGEVTRFTLRNLEEITAGTRGLNPVPPPQLPAVADAAARLAGHSARLEPRLSAVLLPGARAAGAS